MEIRYQVQDISLLCLCFLKLCLFLLDLIGHHLVVIDHFAVSHAYLRLDLVVISQGVRIGLNMDVCIKSIGLWLDKIVVRICLWLRAVVVVRICLHGIVVGIGVRLQLDLTKGIGLGILLVELIVLLSVIAHNY